MLKSHTIARWCAEHRNTVLAALTVLYFAGSGYVAVSKPFWFDEIFTLELSKLGFREILSALDAGLDVTPPLYNWLNHACVLLFGENRLALRLPGLAGCWLMAICLFVFVARRLSPLYAFIAMLCPFWLSAKVYAFEARPYGLMLGIGAAALLLWQWAAETYPAKPVAAAALGVCMAAGSSVDFYFVLLLVPLLAGEIARSVAMQKMDIRIWTALLASVLVLPFHARVILEAFSYAGDVWSRPAWRQLPAFYMNEMGSLLLLGIPLLCCIVLYAAVPSVRLVIPRVLQSRDDHPAQKGLRPHEAAAVAAFMLIPVAAISTAVLLTGIFVFRYALVVTLGASLLAAFACHITDRFVPFSGTAVFLGLALNFVVFQGTRFLKTDPGFAVPALLARALQGPGRTSAMSTPCESGSRPQAPAARSRIDCTSEKSNLPIVIAAPIDYLELAYRLPPETARQLFYVADPVLAKRYSGSDNADRGLLVLQKKRPVNVSSYAAFTSAHRTFLLYARRVYDEPATLEWLPAKLAEDGHRVFLRDVDNRDALYLVNVSAGREN